MPCDVEDVMFSIWDDSFVELDCTVDTFLADVALLYGEKQRAVYDMKFDGNCKYEPENTRGRKPP